MHPSPPRPQLDLLTSNRRSRSTCSLKRDSSMSPSLCSSLLCTPGRTRTHLSDSDDAPGRRLHDGFGSPLAEGVLETRVVVLHDVVPHKRLWFRFRCSVTTRGGGGVYRYVRVHNKQALLYVYFTSNEKGRLACEKTASSCARLLPAECGGHPF